MNLIKCQICGDFTDDIVIPDDRKIICKECFEENYVECCECGETIHLDDVIEQDGEYYCKDCFNENFVKCCECEDIIYRDDSEECYGAYYCKDCFDENFVTCDQCNEFTPIDDTCSDDNIVICAHCYNHYYYRCCGCGSLVYREDVIFVRDEPYCEDCVPEEVIHEYNYKPSPIFYGDGKLFMGVELEIDGGGESDYNAQKILDTGNNHNKHIYIKKDGSLNNGFEIVSHPATLDYHINDMPWEDILRKAEDLGYRSHDVKTCGLHVHLSRKAFGDNESEQDIGIMKLLFIIERFWSKMVRFSRRTEDQLSEYAKRYGFYEKESPEDLLERAKSSGRYYAVNLKNYYTVEIRLFRGTLNYSTFIASLQFCQYLVDVVMNNSVEDIQNLTWKSFVELVPEKYKELKAYLKKRNLMPISTKE